MNLHLAYLEIRGVFRRAVGVVSLGLAVAVGGLAAALPGTSPSTEYSPATVVCVAAYALGWLGLVMAAYLGACIGAEDFEQDVAKVQHLCGRPRMAVAGERLAVVFCTCLVLLLAGAISALTVAAGQALVRVLGSESVWPPTPASGRFVGAAIVATAFSGFMGFAFAHVFRSRLMGVLIWVGGVILYASAVSTVAQSGTLAAGVLRYLPFGPILSGLLGNDNYIDRNVETTVWSNGLSLAGAFVLLTGLLLALDRRRDLA